MYISKKKALEKLDISNTSFFRIQSNFITKKVGRELFVLESSIDDYMNDVDINKDVVVSKAIELPVNKIIDDISNEDHLYDVLVDTYESSIFDVLVGVTNLEGGGLTRLLSLMREAFEDSNATVKESYKKCARGEFSGIDERFIQLFRLLEHKEFQDTITPLGEWI